MPNRTLPLPRAAALLLALSACADPGGELPARLALSSPAVRLELEAARDPLRTGRTTLEWLEDGQAGLGLDLLFDEAERVPIGDRRAYRWKLPRPMARHVPTRRHEPTAAGVGLSALPLWNSGERPPERSFWVRGDELWLTLGPEADEPARVHLVYPILAAHLVDSDLGRGRDLAALSFTRAERGGSSFDALAIAAGVRIAFELPAGGRWRLEGEFLPELPGEPPAVRVWLDRSLAFERVLPPEGSLLPPPGRTGTRLTLEVLGPTGSTVLLRAPEVVDVGRIERVRPPNLVVLSLPSLRTDRLAAWGGSGGLAPALDRLVARSLAFRECWATSSATLPSLASALTSSHVERHRAAREDDRLGDGLTSLAEVLRDAGYRTLAVTDGGVASPAYGLDRGFAAFDARPGNVEHVALRARAAVERAGGGPWFLLVHCAQLEAPYEPPPAARFALGLRHTGWPEGRPYDPRAFLALARAGARFPPELTAALAEMYDEELRWTDRVLGELLGALTAGGRLERTVLCLVAPHGEEFGEHGLGGHGDTLYVEQVHVPLAIAWPDGRRAGELDPRPVSLLDLAPTLLDALGLGRLAAPAGFDGVSLLGSGSPSPVYAARLAAGVGPLRALRRGEWALVSGSYPFEVSRGTPPEFELFRLDQDPLERTNRLSSQARDTVLDLQAEMNALSERQAKRAEPADQVAPDVARRFLPQP